MMLKSKKLSKRLWAEALNTPCYNINHVHLCRGTKKLFMSYRKGKKSDLGYFHIFGSLCFILNNREHLGKFDSKSDEGVFLGYFNNSRAFCVYNMRTQSIIESANVVMMIIIKILQITQLRKKR